MERQSYVPLVRMTAVRERELPYGAKRLNDPALVAELAGQILKDADREYFLVISVDAKSKPMAVEIVSVGTANMACVELREVLKHAIINNAVGIILVHNHPSGDCEPSEIDRNLTQRIVKGAAFFGIEVYDHVIVGDGYYSFKESQETLFSCGRIEGEKE